MAKILLDDATLFSWELDSFSQALLPALCRSAGISFLEDKEGNFILEPPLGNKTIVLRPLDGPDRGLKALLTALRQGLHDRGANVLIVPPAASDGRLFRLWQTQVLFAFTQKKMLAAEPDLRFFYATRRCEESLELIAALVQAMLRSGNPLSYTIPGSWEHFKNFRYRRLLNNADVPSVLIEFCRASLSEEVAYDVATWLTGGLISYFRKPLAEEALFKLQSLLQRFREACQFAGGKSRQEDEEAPVVLSAAVLEEPGTRVSGTGTTGDVPVPGSDERLTVTVAAFAEHSPADEDNKGVKATEDAGVPSREGDIMTGSGGGTNVMVAEVIQEFAVPAKKEILTEDAQGSVPDQAGPPGSSPPPPAKAPLPGAGSPGGGQPAQSIPVTGGGNQAPGPASPVKTLDGGTARRWHRSNPFAPPGGGPVFIFKRPLEATLASSIFPQEVLERMAPLPLYSTFLAAGEPWHYHPSVPLADKARVGPDIGPVSRPEVLKQPPHDPAIIRTVTIRTDSENPVTGPEHGPLAELKNLSAAILAPEQQREPLNGEAPSN